METLLAVSRLFNSVNRAAASAAGWLFLVLAGVVVVDVVTRKFGYQIPQFGSTRLQELEGHLHAALFALWFGFAYAKNAHVRIDIALGRAGPRALAKLEFFGCAFLALPFTLIAAYFAVYYAWTSFRHNEASVSASGLPYLFIPKTVLAIGVVLLAFAVISIMLRAMVFLWGPEHLREQAAITTYRMGAKP
ncbi:MAG TPA: TRAP transporter small permease subunit [Xanthobacteraceae bacterium]|nr:TRAP transporter small permease subunit [Xanthobacteraceae bacterium]